MSSDELTRTQVKVIAEALFPGVNYLVRLRNRMVKAGFPDDDKLFQLVCEAYEASWALRLEVLAMAAHGAGGRRGLIDLSFTKVLPDADVVEPQRQPLRDADETERRRQTAQHPVEVQIVPDFMHLAVLVGLG
jgi:hypothetical protein